MNGGIARYADGTTLAPDRVRRLLCDAELNVIIAGEHAEPLWMSRKVRSATPAQWRALVARDRHCAFPGCHRKPAWCEAHHIEEYDRDTGPTDIDNLALLCRKRPCHRTLVFAHPLGDTVAPGDVAELQAQGPSRELRTTWPVP